MIRVRGNGRTRHENAAAVAEFRQRGQEVITAYVVLSPDGTEAGRHADILDAHDQQREMPTGTCTVTPSGRLLSYRAGDCPSRDMATALRSIDTWMTALAATVVTAAAS